MEALKRVGEILADAERQINELAADALARRDYVSVQRLSRIAQRVASAGNDEAASNTSGSVTSDPETTLENMGTRSDGPVAGTTTVAPRATNRASTDNGYPQFFRDASQLVKIGYSKTDRRTYEHRSPHQILAVVTNTIAKLSSENGKFTTDSLLVSEEPVLSTAPSYQTYMCLAFLVHRGLVTKHGRQGYAAIDPATLASRVEELWAALPKK